MGTYSELLINAVKYFIAKGITSSTEIGRRLGVSPYTVANIKKILREQGEYKPNSLKRGRKPKAGSPKKKKKKKRQRDILDEILGL